MNKFLQKVAKIFLGLCMAAGVGVAIGSNRKVEGVSATEGDELAILQGTGSGYATRKTTTDSHGVGWVLRTGQSGYLGVNNSTNHPNVKPTADDLPVVKAVVSDATTDSTGIYYYFTTTAVSNVGSLTFSCTAHNNASNANPLAYVVSSTTAASSGSATWSQVSLASGSGYTSQGGSISGTSTYTFKFASTQTTAKYYGFVVTVSAYDRWTAGTIKLLEGASATLDSVSTSGQTTSFTEGDNFSYGGTLTATYTGGSTATVTPTSYKYGASGINPTSAGTAITTSDTLTNATHNGQYIYVLYTEGGVTKYASYQITVAAVPAYINLTATSGSSAYTGQTISISASYGGGVAGLNWSIQSGSISGSATTSNSGYSAKLSNTAGTFTVRATDTGNATYSEISISVTKTAFTTSPSATASVQKGSTTTLSAVLNSGGTVNWSSNNTSVATVSNGVVTGVGVGSTTITAQSADDTTVSATSTVTVTKGLKSGIYYTLTPVAGASNNYTVAEDITCADTSHSTSATWNVTGNAVDSPLWRIGGKSITNVARTVYSTTTFQEDIAKIDLTMGAGSSITVVSSSLIVSKNSDFTNPYDTVSIGGDEIKNSTTTLEPTSDKWESGSYFKFVFNVTVSGSNNKYIQFAGADFYYERKVGASISGSDEVNAGSTWSSTGVIDEDQESVSGVTYSFTAGEGVSISSRDTTNGTFVATGSGTVTVSATENTGVYKIDDKSVTVHPVDPYINLTLTSSSSAFTGQTVSISASYGNGVSGLTWTVQSGTVSDVTSSNSSYSAKIGGSSGTLTIRATDTGSALYEEVSVSVTKVTLTLNKNSTTIRQGRSETLTATHNASSAGGVNWTSDNAKVTVGATTGVVTVASDAVVDSTATITATSAVDSSVSATCVVTVAEQPLVYEIAFGSTKNTNPTELTTSTFLSVFSVDSNVSCSAISKMYATNNTNQLKIGSGSYAGSVTLSIPSNQYFVGVEAVIATGANINLQVQSGASGSTLEAQNVTSAGTYTFDDYLSTEKSNIVTISTSASGAIYLTALNLYYAVKVPTITVDVSSHEIYCGELAEATVTIENFASDPTLESHIESDPNSCISDVEIGELENGQAVVLIEGHESNEGTAVVRIRDSANPASYYVDITVVVSEAPAHFINLSVSTDTGTDCGYLGDEFIVTVSSSDLVGNIQWSATPGAVTDVTSDNNGYMGTLASVGDVTITATDTGDNTNTSSVTITVVGVLHEIQAPSTTPHTSDLTFTAACGGSGTADDGASWSVIARKGEDGSDTAAESTYEEARGIHYGTSSAYVRYVQLSSSSFSSADKVIRSVTVNASDAQSTGLTASLTVTVGGVSFHCGNEESVTIGAQNTYTFTGSASGEIVVKADRGVQRQKAIYFKSIVVDYVTNGEISDIANKEGMHLAQKAVLEYAEDFNGTLEEICVGIGSTNTTNLSEAWSELSAQYTSWFTNSGKSLTNDEKAHAKALFANAASVDRNVTATADELEHMLAKYDYIVRNYHYADFLNTDSGTGREAVSQSNPSLIFTRLFNNSTNSVAIIVIISMFSVTAIGGYFFLRKRKENI